ncbi:MAG: type II toxin-antitoxin system HicB family antitoxin [Spirochaetaceae bacterium]|jgi:predicted RNase H-like HicB family nuclease|nr:type II toxin-antitoxin system HicB family antitoxin [Spirochaetaceae bacterium]GMO26769.1 MAG: type II toxin-antitoxin system HicB family antitoxin [Termitinemataceae bacterium]
MKYVYPACFYPEDDGRFSVVLPDFPLATYGADLPEAMYMAQEAAAGRIIYDLEDGEPLPLPSRLESITPEKPNGFVSLVYIDLDLFKAVFDEKPVKKTLTIPSWLNSAAERKNVNFSAVLKEALLEKMQ